MVMAGLQNSDNRCSYNSFLQVCVHTPNLYMLALTAAHLTRPNGWQQKIVKDMHTLINARDQLDIQQYDRSCREAGHHFRELDALLNAASGIMGDVNLPISANGLAEYHPADYRGCYLFDIPTAALRDTAAKKMPPGWEIYGFVLNKQGHFIALTQMNGTWIVYDDTSRTIVGTLQQAMNHPWLDSTLADMAVDTLVAYNGQHFRQLNFDLVSRMHGGKQIHKSRTKQQRHVSHRRSRCKTRVNRSRQSRRHKL